MSNSVMMQVRMLYDHPYGNPNPKAAWVVNGLEAQAGETVEVLFGEGARLVASGYAEAIERELEPIEVEPVPLEAESEDEV